MLKKIFKKTINSLPVIIVIAKKELLSYFTSPLAYIFIIIFLLLTGLTTFGSDPFGNFLGNNQASLSYSLFSFFPWLFLVLIPPIAMRMWSEEQKSGSIELLLTLPLSITEAVIGKFIASWAIVIISTILTFPLIITVNYLGNPDNNIILSGYIASILLAGSYVAIGSISSALCRNQIIAFIINLIACIFLLLIGHPSLNDIFSNWAPAWLADMLSELSLFPHFSYIQKGSFEVMNITYFISIIFFGIISSCLILKSKFFCKKNHFFFKHLENGSYLTTSLSICALLVILINVNFIISIIFSTPFDITSDKLYTFSKGTRNILKNLTQPVTIRFYRSYSDNRMPVQLTTYAQRIEDLLRAYNTYSKEKVIIEYYDPVPDSPAEDSAIMDNIQPNMLPSGEKCYFGLAVSYLNRNSTIAFLSPANEKTIEYDITRSIYDITHHEKPAVGVLSSLPVMGSISGLIPSRFNKAPPWIFIQELQEMFEVRELPYNSTEIDDNIKVLLVIHPVKMSKETEFAIDQYLLRGGSIIIFMDPYCVIKSSVAQRDPLNQSPILPDASNLPRLLHAWGISFSESDEVVISPENAYKQPNDPSGKVHPAVIDITPTSMNKENIVMSGLNSINLIFCGGFSKYKEENFTSSMFTTTPLFYTSPYANYCESFNYYLLPEELTIDFKSLNHPINLGLHLSGFFETAFPDGTGILKKDDSNKNHLKKSLKQGNVILIGDVDMLYNNFCVSERKVNGKSIFSTLNSNIDLVLNSVDYLSGDTDIMAIRARSSVERKFTRLEEIYNEAARTYQDKLSDLQKKLVQTEASISKLQSGMTANDISNLTPKELKTLQQFKKESKKTKIALQNIRKKLRLKLDNTKRNIIFFDVALIPIIVTCAGIAVGILRKRKHKKNLNSLNFK